MPNYKKCKKCSNFSGLDDPGKYCTYCGAEMIAACPACSTPIENPYGIYCKNCGEKLSEHEDKKLK